jgi:uncharacterized membrane protein
MVHAIQIKEKINNMKKQTTHFFAILISLLPAAYLIVIWNSLPQQVAVHFNAQMQPDRYGNKSELWLVTGFMAAISIGMYFLLRNLHRIDPKRRNAEGSSVFHKLAFGMVVFLAALNFIILASAKGVHSLQNLLLPLLGLLFAFLGNYMITIKPNYFAGFRLPWTLSDDTNWRKTHQLGGRLWFAGGIVIALVSLFLPSTAAFAFFIIVMVILVAIPVIYSYRLFKKQS